MVALASRQHGSISRRQLRALRVTPEVIDGALADGLLLSAHRGVYWVGRAGQTVEAHAMAAILAYGVGAIACRHTAAYLLKLLPYPAQPPSVSLLVPGRASTPRPGIRIHRVPSIHHRDRRTHDGIPVTSPARTLLDLAACAADSDLERTFDEAWFRGLARKAQVEELLGRSAGARGVRRLRALYESEVAGERNRREAEKRMAAVRVTWRQLRDEGTAVVARVAAALSASGRELRLG